MTEHDTETAPPPETAEPIEPGWYAYSGGAQVMVFHLDRHGNWSVHTDSGTGHPCDWSYIEQALGGDWTLDRIPLPVPSPVLNPPEVLAVLVEQWGAESVYDAFASRYPAVVRESAEAVGLAPRRPRLIESYQPDLRHGLLIDGEPIPWYMAAATRATPLVEEADPSAPGVAHILWVPLMVDAALPTPREGHPEDAEPLTTTLSARDLTRALAEDEDAGEPVTLADIEAIGSGPDEAGGDDGSEPGMEAPESRERGKP